MSVEEHMFLILIRSITSPTPPNNCAFGVVSKKPLPNLRLQRFYSKFSSKCFIFGFIICFELNFKYGEWIEAHFFFFCFI